MEVTFTSETFEKTSSITDVVLALCTFVSGILVLRRARKTPNSRAVAHAGIFLVLIAAALAGGAVFHALDRTAEANARDAIWAFEAVTSSLGFVFLLSAVISDAFRGTWLTDPLPVSVACCIALAGPCFAGLHLDSFKPILFLELGSMLVHIVGYLWLGFARAGMRKRAALAVVGDLVCVAAGAVQASSLKWGKLDHNGLYHVIQVPSSLLMCAAYLVMVPGEGATGNSVGAAVVNATVAETTPLTGNGDKDDRK